MAGGDGWHFPNASTCGMAEDIESLLPVLHKKGCHSEFAAVDCDFQLNPWKMVSPGWPPSGRFGAARLPIRRLCAPRHLAAKSLRLKLAYLKRRDYKRLKHPAQPECAQFKAISVSVWFERMILELNKVPAN